MGFLMAVCIDMIITAFPDLHFLLLCFTDLTPKDVQWLLYDLGQIVSISLIRLLKAKSPSSKYLYM